MKIPYRDLSVKDAKLRGALVTAVEGVLSHGRFIFGPEHERFEQEMARYCRRKHGLGVNSGTDALYLALRALDIGAGDEVITTPLSWIATVNAMVLCGAVPVFADIGTDLNINPDLIEGLITARTKAIVPVHFTGQMCDMRRIMEIAGRHNLIVIEDGAQAFGASHHGTPCGSFGEASCFSMNPMKVYNGFGEAGAIVTDNDRVRERVLSLRYNGTVNKQDCHWPSLNGRLDTIQAAMLLVNLNYLEEKIAKRRVIADWYRDRLAGLVETPVEQPGNRHIYYAYTVQADRRDELMQHLASRGVETQVQHPIPMPHHTAYRGRFRADIPLCEALVKRILCLPNQEDLSVEEVDYVCESIREFYG